MNNCLSFHDAVDLLLIMLKYKSRILVFREVNKNREVFKELLYKIYKTPDDLYSVQQLIDTKQLPDEAFYDYRKPLFDYLDKRNEKLNENDNRTGVFEGA